MSSGVAAIGSLVASTRWTFVWTVPRDGDPPAGPSPGRRGCACSWCARAGRRVRAAALSRVKVSARNDWFAAGRFCGRPWSAFRPPSSLSRTTCRLGIANRAGAQVAEGHASIRRCVVRPARPAVDGNAAGVGNRSGGDQVATRHELDAADAAPAQIELDRRPEAGPPPVQDHLFWILQRDEQGAPADQRIA